VDSEPLHRRIGLRQQLGPCLQSFLVLPSSPPIRQQYPRPEPTVDITFLCHQFQSSLSLRILFARSTLFLKSVLVPLDLVPQIADGLRILYFKSDCREHAFLATMDVAIRAP
jgi:hypothetical protein